MWIETCIYYCDVCGANMLEEIKRDSEILLRAGSGVMDDINEGHIYGLDDFVAICKKCRSKEEAK